MRFKKETYSDILATNKWISSQQELAKFIIDSSGDQRELAQSKVDVANVMRSRIGQS